VRSCAMLTLVALLFCAILSAQTAAQQQPTPSAFDEQTASRLLLQLSESLQGHSQKQFLALFDLDRMKEGALFKQQINSFFAQTESIRVHLNLVDTSVDGDKANIAVEAEMEAEPGNGGAPSRRNEQLNFVVTNAGGSWKFVDLRPRSFFSLP
jgi:K+-sensing histidine kinase KdpD